jgi:hypothetical protein
MYRMYNTIKEDKMKKEFEYYAKEGKNDKDYIMNIINDKNNSDIITVKQFDNTIYSMNYELKFKVISITELPNIHNIVRKMLIELQDN